MSGTGRTLFYGPDERKHEVLYSVLPLGFNCMDVSNGYHTVEGVYHPSSLDVPQVVPQAVKSGSQHLCHVYKYVRISLVFRLDKRGIHAEYFVGLCCFKFRTFAGPSCPSSSRSLTAPCCLSAALLLVSTAASGSTHAGDVSSAGTSFDAHGRQT